MYRPHSFVHAVVAACLVTFLAAGIHTQAAGVSHEPDLTNSLAAGPVAFTQNLGQWPDSIFFRASVGEATMWFTRDGVYYQFTRRVPRTPTGEAALSASLGPRQLDRPNKCNPEDDSIETAMVKAEFVGASRHAELVGLHKLDYSCNYYLGNDPARWRTGVPNYAAISIKGIYPGVDLTFRGENNNLTCQYSTDDHAKLALIHVRYIGGSAVTTQADGTTAIQTALGEKFLSGILLGAHSNGTVQASAASPAALTLVYSTCLGGSDADNSVAIGIDGTGCAIVAGSTSSTDFPTQFPYQTDPGDNNLDAFVTKVSATGSSLVYSTYLGGNNLDAANGIAVDIYGTAYVTGQTKSTNFPTLNPYQADPGDNDYDVFVTKLSPSGGLVYSTYIGGASGDIAEGIAVDESGCAYVTGGTDSYNYPTLGPYQTDQPYRDGFVTKLSAAGNSLIYSTFLGGSGVDAGGAIALDNAGSAYVTGWTFSSSFPTVNPFQTDPGDNAYDVFVAKLAVAGNSLVYSTYLGGSNNDWGMSIKVDGQGNAYAVGYTASSNFPTQTPYQTYQGPTGAAFGDAFVTKLSPAGNTLVYSTYLGGTGDDAAVGVAVDTLGSAYVTGVTWSTNFPTLMPFQTDGDGTLGDAFVTKLLPSGNSLTYSTYLGGQTGDDAGYTVAVNNAGQAFVTGNTSSSDFPTQNPYQTYQAAGDAFVTKLIPSCCTGTTGNVNMIGIVDLSDLSMLIAYLTANPRPVLLCPAEANVNATGIIDLIDLSLLIAYLTANPKPTLPNCP